MPETLLLKMKLNPKKLIDFKFFLLVLLAVPVLTVGHELGHILAGKLLGFKTYFFLLSSLVFPTRNSGCYPECGFEEFLVHLGGPLFSWIVIAIGFVGFWRTSKKNFLLGLAALAPFYYNLLWVLETTFFSQKLKMSLSDEYKIAAYLGWPPILISVTFVLIGTFLLFKCYRRIKNKERLPLVSASVLGVLVDFLLFWVFLKPRILYSLVDWRNLLRIWSEMEGV